MMADRDLEDLFTIVGVIHHVTSLGVFLDVGDRRVFVGQALMEPLAQPLTPGEPATLRVQRWFARQKAWRSHRTVARNFTLADRQSSDRDVGAASFLATKVRDAGRRSRFVPIGGAVHARMDG